MLYVSFLPRPNVGVVVIASLLGGGVAKRI